MNDESDMVALARLAQESFEARRRYEWRINFSLWGALGAVGYWTWEEGVRIFDSRCGAYGFGSMLLVLYLVSLFLINHGHRQDKDWKHYYMRRALGQDVSEPQKPFLGTRATQGLWCLSQGGFTAAIIYLVLQVLLGVNPRN